MFKLIFLLFLFTYQVNCESELMTTLSPNYSVNQVGDEIISSVDQVENESPKVNLIIKNQIIDYFPEVPTEVKHVPNDDFLNSVPANSEVEKELATMMPEITTMAVPTVHRIKRAPRYTIREILYPNGIMHEIGHLRDHGVNRVAKGLGKRMRSSLFSRLAHTSANRVFIHHNYHHIPNHLAYLPVVGRFLDERNKKVKRV